MSRRKREREAPEVGAMAGRVIRALVRRASEGDGEALEQLLSLEAQLSSAIKDAGAGMHRFGYSFTELGTIAGISRQAARERFGGPAETRCMHGRTVTSRLDNPCPGDRCSIITASEVTA